MKIILIGIVKNEEKIIKRCIESLKDILDGICITDTGSSDTTIQQIETCASDLNIPCKVYQNDWLNFGHNRSLSFNNAQEFIQLQNWNLDECYGLLLDADMELKISNFDKTTLVHDEYKIIQESSVLSYYNTRLIKMCLSWKCIGVTHEYWECENVNHTREKLTKDILYIQDIGDGGSKGDKFQRDILLLEDGLKNEPNNKRYYFYLAQSYKDIGNYNKAIEFYTKRIEMGGWQEEIWYSYYMISECWKLLENSASFIEYALKAYNYRPSRAESIYSLTKYYRENGDYANAYKYYLIGKNIKYPKDILFIEKNVYTFLFDYEYSILQYYVKDNHLEGLIHSMRFINKFDNYTCNIVFSNMEYYTPRLLDFGTMIDLHIQPNKNFIPSSISLIKLDDTRILANIRFVNYKINRDGSYSYLGKIATENYFVIYDHNFKSLTQPQQMETSSSLPRKDVNILGLEDVRLYRRDTKIYYTAASLEYSYDNCIRIINGEYDYQNNKFINNIVLKPPEYTSCEKNWIGYNDYFIYKWYPLEIGELNGNQLNIVQTKKTPSIFKYFRGSSNLFEYNNELWCITHYVKHSSPRKYFHNIIVLDKDLNLLRYSIPFYFDSLGIEYCLGIFIMDNVMSATVSRNDSNPIICQINLDNIFWFIYKN
jgi:tetratricopeptide (TPR) repeat protein